MGAAELRGHRPCVASLPAVAPSGRRGGSVGRAEPRANESRGARRPADGGARARKVLRRRVRDGGPGGGSHLRARIRIDAAGIAQRATLRRRATRGGDDPDREADVTTAQVRRQGRRREDQRVGKIHRLQRRARQGSPQAPHPGGRRAHRRRGRGGATGASPGTPVRPPRTPDARCGRSWSPSAA